jgi:hypothetical protein
MHRFHGSWINPEQDRTGQPSVPGEHPVSDLLFHGRHPFPPEVERLILRLHQVNPRVWRELACSAENWTRLPASGASCGRVVEYLNGLLHDQEIRAGRTH